MKMYSKFTKKCKKHIHKFICQFHVLFCCGLVQWQAYCVCKKMLYSSRALGHAAVLDTLGVKTGFLAMLSCLRIIMHSNTLFSCLSGFMSTRRRLEHSGALNSPSSLKDLEAVLHEQYSSVPLHAHQEALKIC